MKFGLVIFPTDYSITLPELARAAEELGFESLFVTEHTHIPTSRLSPWSGGPELPQHYWHTLDPFVGLTAAAMVTERLLVGTAVCLVIEHDPIVLAKQVATIDLVSGGRFLFGVGGGWNAEEMENHGTPFNRRWKVLRERVEAMKAIWTQEEPEYHGEFVDFGPIWSWPKPVQKPYPPVFVGGDGETTLKRVVRYGDAWLPRWNQSGTQLAEKLAELRRLAEEAGRSTPPTSVYGVPPKPEGVETVRELGVERAIFNLPSKGRDDVLRLLEDWAKLI
jgi:probable F420-dependent oxidoreductase